MSISDSPLKAMRFVHQEVYPFDNITFLHERMDKLEDCLDKIANNQTDLVSNWVSLETHVPHVYFFAITDSSTQVILSAYDQTISTSVTSVLSSFNAWSPAVVTVFSLLLLSAVIMFKVHSAIHRGYKSSIARTRQGPGKKKVIRFHNNICITQYVLCLMMYQIGSCPNLAGVSRKSFSFKLTHFMMLMLIFMISFFFNSFIVTDLVTLHDVIIIDSFQQILEDSKLKVKWLTHESDYKLFQDADPSNVKHRLWQRSKPDANVAIQHGPSGLDFIGRLNRSEIVLIGSHISMKVCHQVMCPIARSANFRPLITRYARDDGEEKVRSSVCNDQINRSLMKRLAFRMRLVTERGIIDHLHSLIDASDPQSDPADIRICRENSVSIREPPQVKQKVMADYETLFQTYTIFSAATFIPLSLSFLRLWMMNRMKTRLVCPSNFESDEEAQVSGGRRIPGVSHNHESRSREDQDPQVTLNPEHQILHPSGTVVIDPV
jgi:hypothetical protein